LTLSAKAGASELPAPLCRSNCKALRMLMATRSAGVPFGALIGGMSTAANLSCTPSPPGGRAP
jgi:hypothetical protein